MSDPAAVTGPPAGDVEEVDGLPVLAAQTPGAPARGSGSRELERVSPRPLQAAAVAASGFLAGAAVAGLLHRRRQRHALALRPTRRARGADGRAGELVRIVGSRSLLVDVHLLGGRE